MSFNTQTFKKAVGTPKAKRAMVYGYRGLSSAAIVWLYATFPSKEWVKAINTKVSCQQAEIQQLKIELAVERATSIHLKPQKL